MVNAYVPNSPSVRSLRKVVLALLVSLTGSVAAAEQQVTSDLVYWARHELSIPYAWSGTGTNATEVVLYYSTDRGRSWKKAASAQPHVRAFRFHAPGDGEYWFAIRTYDALGRATPAEPLGKPEMRVLVDTASPRVERLEATLSGDLLAVDLAARDNVGIVAEAIRVYAQAAGQPGWTPVPLSTTQPTEQLSGDGQSIRLTGQWRAAGATQVSVRATIADQAGNRIEESATAQASAAPAANMALNGTASGNPSRPSWEQQPKSSSSYGTVDPFAVAEAATPAPSASMAEPRSSGSRRSVPSRQAPSSTPWPSDTIRSLPLIAKNEPTGDRSPFSSASFRGAERDPFDKEVGSSASTRGTSRPPTRLPSHLPSRLVNSTEFEFDYQLEDAGRWGVAKVELWGTDNNGRSWRRFAIDSDQQSPIHVSVPGEGEYGFRLVIESIGGLDAVTPRPGDMPEAIVGVDLQSPRVTLSDSRQGDGYFADQLVINWRVDDAHLSERPIDLYYSNRSSGPWIPIATSLANTGRHSWRLQRHLPRRVYLKIEAHDEAGNSAQAISPEPLVIDVPTASGSLQGVRAAR